MFANYLKTAYRNLLRHRGHTLISVAGLALGMACCLLIVQYVAFEYSFDRFNENEADLYRVVTTTSRNGAVDEPGAPSAWALGPSLKDEVPEVERFARIHPDYTNPVISNAAKPDAVFEERRVLYADPAFLQMFTYPFVAGDAENALAEPGTIVVSESTARKYFGEENPVGRDLELRGWVDGSFRITGVLEDVPPNSHLQFDFLLPMSELLENSGYSDASTGWNWSNFYTYIELRGGSDVSEVNRKSTDVYMRYRGDDFRESNTTARLTAQPLRDVHLNNEVFAPDAAAGSYRTVYFFSIVALITLIIALVNYVNLATARALDRAREVGVRKVAGARRSQLVGQFFFEAALTNLAAIVLALAMAASLRPVVNSVAGTNLSGSVAVSPWFLAVAAIAFLAGTLLAGLYPALVLSSYRPVAVLKGKGSKFASGLLLRKSLVVLQFSASVVLVVGTAMAYSQLSYMRTLDLGIELEQVLGVTGPRVLSDGVDRSEVLRTFLQEVRKLPAVTDVATSTSLPSQGFDFYAQVRQSTADPSTSVSGVFTTIDANFARMYGLEVVAGTGFENFTAAPAEGQPIPAIANESASAALGFENPADALDKLVTLGGREARIVGVFRDFNWLSAHEVRENAFFGFFEIGGKFSLKLSTSDLSETIASIEQIYTTLFPGNPFNYAFVDDQFDAQYRNDQKFALLFGIFSSMAILIACLGLFGLAGFTTRQRTKEIGIRKVLGASVAGIVGLLSRDFLKLVLIAFVIATPLAYVGVQQWLERFAYRIDIGPGIFLITGALVLLIAVGTVSYQSIRAAVSDPVKSLRYE